VWWAVPQTEFEYLLTDNILVWVILLGVSAGALGLYVRYAKTRAALARLKDHAEAIASGDGTTLPEETLPGDARHLARSLNRVSDQLKLAGTQARESTEALERAHTRFGEALRATHDLDRILEVALETGMETVRARRGLLALRKGATRLDPAVARNLDPSGLDLHYGRGIVGEVAASGKPARVPGPGSPDRHESEPQFDSLISVPLVSRNRVIGVLTLYDKDGQHGFSEDDLKTILLLADQAGVAIENVLLHRDAQRMAIMDGLTGIWNHRWFQIQFAQELDRAERFKRPFSLLVLDIDDFKRFNDTYGHQVGDFVLVELARRIKSVIRDVDMFARYGGEEFELLLSETDAAGGLKTAQKILAVVNSAPFTSDLAPEPLHVTISVGVASYPNSGIDRPSIFLAADQSMYTAKRQGKNQVVAHLPHAQAG
jgi:two-component system, cell cycle response regulator